MTSVGETGEALAGFLHLLQDEGVRVGNDIYSVPALAFDAIEGVVGHPTQKIRTQWVFG